MIETARLKIIPLTYEQLLLYTQPDHALEAVMQLNPVERPVSPALEEALRETILPAVADPGKNYLYTTLWTAILKAENKMIGDLCFVGEPNAEGAIEIGYGTYEEFQGRGLMTEAVQGMIQWARTQPAVKTILADTEKSNLASSAVLVKNAFIQFGETETLYNWRLELDGGQPKTCHTPD